MKKRYPESLMMSYGYQSKKARGALKCPIYQTSTFVFESAESGKAFFAKAYNLDQDMPSGSGAEYIYSRLGNPNLDILEKRLSVWENSEAGAVFASGMAAITSVFFTFLKPGDLLVYSNPTYGGTDHVIQDILSAFHIKTLAFMPGEESILKQRILKSGYANRLKLIFVESPANPTNTIVDIEACSVIAKSLSTENCKPLVCVDNTFLGPLWQHPLEFGADLVVYSATKYLSGHSDLVAGAVLGNASLIQEVKGIRSYFGNMPSPMTAWLLMRSLETLKVRMDAQLRNAVQVVRVLQENPHVGKILYPQLLDPDSQQFKIYRKQCSSPGAMISFEVGNTEAEAFQFIDNLKLIKTAVSLGGTESLAQHPASMTHAGFDPVVKVSLGINPNLVRLSIGIENIEDLIEDIKQALENSIKPQKDDARKQHMRKEIAHY